MRKGTIHLATGFLLIGILQAQDIRLLDIKTIYILPNGDAKEIKQFRERIPKEVSWEIVYDKSKADALWFYQMGSEGLGTVVIGNPTSVTGIPIIEYKKTVAVLTNDESQEFLWRHDKDSWVKIAGEAVKKLKLELNNLKRLKRVEESR